MAEETTIGGSERKLTVITALCQIGIRPHISSAQTSAIETELPFE